MNVANKSSYHYLSVRPHFKLWLFFLCMFFVGVFKVNLLYVLGNIGN